VRIALVTDTYVPQVNGVTTVVHRIARVLASTGVPRAIVAPAYPGAAAEPGELRIRSLAFPPYPAIRLSRPAAWRVVRFLSAFEPLAAVVCASRVTLRVHHLSDVLAGALPGLGGAWAVVGLVL
jgi:membrane-associated phospholipid phosphatase